MLETLLETMKDLEKSDELFQVGARIMKKTYDALIDVGFNPDQATKIVATQGASVKIS